MSTQERCAIEKLFRIGYLYILIASSTIGIIILYKYIILYNVLYYIYMSKNVNIPILKS